MEESQKVNMSISEGEVFFCHEVSINFNPTQFVFDFKSVTPRIDPRSADKATIALKHNVVLVDAYHAKQISELLIDVLKKYEADFGKVEKPKALQTFEKKNNKKIKESDKDKTKAPSYFG